MNKKLTLYYRISIFIASLFISGNILIKTVIWHSASLKSVFQGKPLSAITIFTHTPGVRYKYTTKLNQSLFNKADSLLTPAFIILFVAFAVKLVKTPEIFKLEK